MDLDPVRVRLLARIQKRGTDLKNASLAIGRNGAYLHQFIYRGTPKVLAEDDRAALARLLECNEDELRHVARPPRKPRSRPSPGVAVAKAGTVPAGYVAVPEIDVRASAGAGVLNEGFVETRAQWVFPETMVRHELRVRPADLRMITVDGDSMEPLLSSGDRILIDTSQRVPAPPGIFVVWDGMGLVAKRIEHKLDAERARLVIKSLNPDYETYERDAEEVHVTGRVVWAARRL